MYTLTMAVLSGMIATSIMIAMMELIIRSKLANTDMVRAIGSILQIRMKIHLNQGCCHI